VPGTMASKRQLRRRTETPSLASPSGTTMDDIQSLLDRQSERLALLSTEQHEQTTKSLAALSVSINTIEQSVRDNSEQILDLKRKNASLEADLSLLKEEVALLKAAPLQARSIVHQRGVAENNDERAAEDARAVADKDDLVLKLRSSADILLITCSNGRSMNPKYIGSQTGKYCFRENSPQLADMTAIISNHPASPKVVVISCLTNDLDALSTDPMPVANKVAELQKRLNEQVALVNSKWADAEIIIELPPPILSAGEHRDIRANTLWMKDVQVELDLAHGQPRKSTVVVTDWCAMKMPFNGRLFWPESVMRDEKHVGEEGARVRQNNLIRHICAVAPGATQTTKTLFPTFRKLRELKQSLPENSNVFFNPNRNVKHKPSQNYDQDFPVLTHPAAGRTRPANNTYFSGSVGRQNLSSELTDFLACWLAYQQSHSERQPHKPVQNQFQNGGYM
jgi:hypothetical protein